MVALQRRWIALGRHLVPSPALAVVLLAGLAPFIWVQSGYVAKAEDFILPMNLDQWAEFFSTWQTRVGFGSSPDDRLAAVFFLFWPALFRALGASIELAQRLQFVLWFSAMGLSMYVLMRHLTTSRIAWAAASLFYMFNFYQEPVWQGVNIANLSALVALPLALAVTISFTRNNRLLICAGLLALITVVGSGVGANPPMALIAMIPVPLYMTMYIIHRFATGRARQARRMITMAALAVILIVAVNAYWLIPQAYGLISGGPGQNFIGRTKDVGLAQLTHLSQYTAPLNVWRLQGAWVWYDGFKGVPYIPYAASYLMSPLLIIGSFMLPAAALGGLAVRKDRKLLFFGVLAFLGLMLSSGTNGPFGPLFAWLWDNIPLFWVLRSPWYKATSLTILGFAPLAGIFVAVAAESTRKFLARSRLGARYGWVSRAISAGFPLLLAVLYLLYTLPIVRGQFLIQRPLDSPLSTLQVQIPDYVVEAAAWMNEHPGDYRVLSFPPALRLTTDWGYTGYIPPIGELTSEPFINLVEPSEMQAYLYAQTLGARTGAIARVAGRSGIGYFLHQRDVVRPEFPDNLDDFIDGVLKWQGINEVARFGPLVFYAVPDPRGLVWGTPLVVFTLSGMAALGPLTNGLTEIDPAIVMIGAEGPGSISARFTEDIPNASSLRFGDGSDEFLAFSARVKTVTIPPGSRSADMETPVDGAYEIWEWIVRAPPPGLDLDNPALLTHDLFPIVVGPRAPSVNGTPLSADQPSDISELPNSWVFWGSFQGTRGTSTLELGFQSPEPDGLQLVLVLAADRLDFLERVRSEGDSGPVHNPVYLFDRITPKDIVPQPDEMGVSVSLKDNWDEAEVGAGGAISRRLRAVQQYSPNLEISNLSGSTQTIAMILRPTPVGPLSRSLWIHTGGSFHSIYLLQPSVPRDVLVLGIEVEPGTNYVNLYSPEYNTLLSDGSFASFEYEMPILIGTIKRERTFTLPRDGAYRIGVNLLFQGSTDVGPQDLLDGLRIDGQELLSDLTVEDQYPIATTTIDLSAGAHTLVIDQNVGSSIAITLVPAEPKVALSSGLDIQYESLSATHLRASVRTSEPIMIVLNELFDSRWEATIDGTPVETHLRVNGFANGFFVDRIGEYEIEFVFNLQPLADATRNVSAASIALLAAILVTGLARDRVARKTRHPESAAS